MKIHFKIFLFLFLSTLLKAQGDFKDTIWFDTKWNENAKANAKYYRVYKKVANTFIVYDKYLNGKTQMYTEAREIKPSIIQEGYTIYYNENSTRSSRGFFKDDKKTGNWVQYFENERDSSVYEVLADGSLKYSRKSPLQKEEVFTIVETNAEFSGGINEMIKFIQNNLKYPETANKLRLGGKVFLKFIITETGTIESVEVLKGSGDEDMDSEAIRVVQSMPKWKPANMTGVNVKCYFNLPLSFSMSEPFYVYNKNNNSSQYTKLTRLIFEGKTDEAYSMIDKFTPDRNDADFFYNKAVLLFYSNKKTESCQLFKKVLEMTENKSTVYNNSNKFYKQYCN